MDYKYALRQVWEQYTPYRDDLAVRFVNEWKAANPRRADLASALDGFMPWPKHDALSARMVSALMIVVSSEVEQGRAATPLINRRTGDALVKRGLLWSSKQESNPKYFSLTDAGREQAIDIVKERMAHFAR